jgi:alpha-tubulin suppressor-like RCC1 family protein
VVPTLGRGVTDVDTGVSHTCAVVATRVECWGSNSSGQLGNGTFTSSTRPVAVLD